MANMSYCRFENTVSDLQDCLEALEGIDFVVENLGSDTEQRAAKHLIEICRKISEGDVESNGNPEDADDGEEDGL